MSQKKIVNSKTIFQNESKDIDETTGRSHGRGNGHPLQLPTGDYIWPLNNRITGEYIAHGLKSTCSIICPHILHISSSTLATSINCRFCSNL